MHIDHYYLHCADSGNDYLLYARKMPEALLESVGMCGLKGVKSGSVQQVADDGGLVEFVEFEDVKGLEAAAEAANQ